MDIKEENICISKKSISKAIEEKLILVDKLTKKPKTDEESVLYPENFYRGLSILKEILLNRFLPSEDKLQALAKLYEIAPDEGQDMLYRWKDSIIFLKGRDLDDMLKILTAVSMCNFISSHERISIVVSFYNLGFIDICYDCFAELAADSTMLLEYRVEASRYLFMTEKYKELAQNILLEAINSDLFSSHDRYGIIAGFISKTGISSTLNFTKLKIPYDEDFVYGLQTNFFYNEQNDVRDRILSGQHILQMDCAEEKEKDEVTDILFEIADDTSLENAIRADAADVILREGKDKKRARQIISSLGFSAVPTTGFGISHSLLDRSRIIYNDAENIHAFTDQINRFIEKIVDINTELRPYSEIHAEVVDIVKKYTNSNKEKFKAMKALNRISVDTARFTEYKVTLAEIFVHTWTQITSYPSEQKIELEKRLVEELVDMGDTCSSGHSGRFVNVLSMYDDTLKISWEEQLKSNIAGRLNARIRDCPDEELRTSLAMANSEMAEEEDHKNYRRFISEQIPLLKQELQQEFVGEGYISLAEFEEAFSKSIVEWVLDE